MVLFHNVFFPAFLKILKQKMLIFDLKSDVFIFPHSTCVGSPTYSYTVKWLHSHAFNFGNLVSQHLWEHLWLRSLDQILWSGLCLKWCGLRLWGLRSQIMRITKMCVRKIYHLGAWEPYHLTRLFIFEHLNL